MPHLPVMLAATIASGAALGVAWPGTLTSALSVACCAWVGALTAWHRGWPRSLVACGLAGIAAAAAVLGGMAFTAVARAPLVTVLEEAGALAADARPDEATVRLEGRLTADAAPMAGGALLRLQVRRVWTGSCGCPQAARGGLVAFVAGGLAAARVPEWRAGRHVTLTAAVRRPRAFRNRGSPDAHADLVRRRGALVATAKSALLVEPAVRGSLLSEAAAAVRSRARAALRRAAGPGGEDAAAIGTAVLVGDRAGLDVTLQQQLQRAGTYHVIAISGGNIALFSALVLAVTRALSRRRRAGLLAAGLVLAAYAAVVGGGASVLRATGMALVGIAAQMLDQRSAGLNVLALTGGLLIAADPLLAFDVSFWLTTAATAGILLSL
ncbi:MAG TPA: ComEC/Rec2 family competence protein, partial [Vicinamibacterales bacterium]|nr:ComEC/Rec2 family competence protein [Vicinamibacterales bacterium]